LRVTKSSVKKKKILFIVNPVSGLFAKHRVPHRVEKYLDHNQFDYEIRLTERPGHATELSAWAVKQNFDIVVAAGGDGSVNEVARGLIGSNVALGIIPLGSGNGFANNIGLRPHQVIDAIRNFNHGNMECVDLGESDLGIFVSNLGIGFDAHVAHRFAKYKLRGLFSYLNASLGEYFFSYKCDDVILVMDGKELKRKIFMCSVFNSNQYGYHIGPLKRAGLKDGFLEIFVLNKFPKWQVFWYSWLLMIKRAEGKKHVEVFRVKEFKIRKEGKMILQYDGEPAEWENEINLCIKPISLNVITRPNTNEK